MSKHELRKQIEDQVALEKRAHKHVENMVLTDAVGKDYFQTVLNEIMPGHYADIVEERSIAKLCGYPLCSNRLSKVPNQQFHISLKAKKIYDITERKLFCSNSCFKSSNYIKSQISSDPLWLRTAKVMFEFHERPAKKIDDKEGSTESERHQPHVEYDTHFLKDNENQVNYADCDIKEPTEVRTERHTKVIKLPATFNGDAHVVNIDRLCEILGGWCTFDTYKFLKSHDFKDSSESGDLPNYEEEPGKRKWKSAKTFLINNAQWKAECQGNISKDQESRAFVSPPIDSKSQNSIRRSIVAQKLKHSFSEIFSGMHIPYCDFQLDIFSLLKTFKFTNKNISLRPNEWKVMAVAILHGFAMQDITLQELIDERIKEIDGILTECGTDRAKFAKLLSVLDQFVQKRPTAIGCIETGDCDYDNDSLD